MHQFPTYQPVPSGGGNPYQQPPAAGFNVQQPISPVAANMPRGASADNANPPEKEPQGVESEEVALNDNGGITRAMLYMVVEDGPLLSENGAKKTDAMSYLRGCMVRWAVIPMLVQTIFMYFLCLEVHYDNWPGEDSELTFSQRAISMLAIMIYFWSIADLFFLGTLRQWFLLTRGHYSGINRCTSILLFIWECCLLIALFVAGSLFIALNSGTELDAIMNALAVNYIIEIDDYITAFTSSMGGYQNAHVPSKVVMSESNQDWSGCYKTWVCISNNLICNPILPLVFAFAVLTLTHGGLLEDSSDLYFLLAVVAILVITSDFMCQCYKFICCCARDVDGMDSSSSEVYGMSRGKSDL